MAHVETDLCYAASQGDVAMLRELVKSGHDAGVGDYDGRTPLHLAASENKLKVLYYLVMDAKVDVNPIDRWGSSPLDDAIRTRHHEATAFLKGSGALSGKGDSMFKRLRNTAKGITHRDGDLDKSRSGLDGSRNGEAFPPSETLGGRQPTPPKPGRQPSVPQLTQQPPGSSQPSGAATRAPASAACGAEATLQKLGKLTKLSKGGYTANWNRRTFAIVGSSLYYSDSLKSLCKPMQAKLFCELAGSTVGLLPDAARFSMPGRSSLPPSFFVISWETASESPAGAEDQVLLLAGDSEKHSTEWVSALQRAGPLPPCSPERVAQLVKAESTQPTAPGLSHFVEDSEDIL